MIEDVCERIVRHERPDLVPRALYLDQVLNNGLEELIPKDASIVQYGSACGYMLDVLKLHGYTNLTGVDNDSGMEKDWMPDVKFICSTARWAMQTLPKHDVVLFHRFLYTLPPTERTDDFFKLAAKSFKKHLLVIEEETGTVREGQPARYYRNYKEVFEGLGLKEVWQDSGSVEAVTFRIFTK